MLWLCNCVVVKNTDRIQSTTLPQMSLICQIEFGNLYATGGNSNNVNSCMSNYWVMKYNTLVFHIQTATYDWLSAHCEWPLQSGDWSKLFTKLDTKADSVWSQSHIISSFTRRAKNAGYCNNRAVNSVEIMNKPACQYASAVNNPGGTYHYPQSKWIHRPAGH